MPPETETTESVVDHPGSGRADFRSMIGSLAGHLGADHLRGDTAELRRAGESVSPAFYRAFFRHDLASWRAGGPLQTERTWAVILSCLATMPGLHSYDRKDALGTALAEANLSERRLVQLIRSRGDGLHRQARQVAQRLAASHTPANHADLAWLIWTDAGHSTSERGEHTRERARRTLARDYFRHLHAAQKER